ncbi:DUF1616 domain-containing protein [Chloroflexota bacterium]
MKLFNRSLTIFLAALILAALGVLGYILASPKAGNAITEFYISGREGPASDYPVEFFMENGEVTAVKYSDSPIREEDSGILVLGIVNRGHEAADYVIKVLIDGIQSTVFYDGDMAEEIGSIQLAGEEKWENEVGIIPDNTGNNQKVEFVLYKDGTPCFEEPLYLWIDVTD